MIRAVAAFARGEGPPPPVLQQAFDARGWGALPEAGGLRDQRPGELARMTTAYNVYQAYRGFLQATDPRRWAQDHPEGWQIVRKVRELERG